MVALVLSYGHAYASTHILPQMHKYTLNTHPQTHTETHTHLPVLYTSPFLGLQRADMNNTAHFPGYRHVMHQKINENKMKEKDKHRYGDRIGCQIPILIFFFFRRDCDGDNRIAFIVPVPGVNFCRPASRFSYQSLMKEEKKESQKVNRYSLFSCFCFWTTKRNRRSETG